MLISKTWWKNTLIIFSALLYSHYFYEMRSDDQMEVLRVAGGQGLLFLSSCVGHQTSLKVIRTVSYLWSWQQTIFERPYGLMSNSLGSQMKVYNILPLKMKKVCKATTVNVNWLLLLLLWSLSLLHYHIVLYWSPVSYILIYIKLLFPLFSAEKLKKGFKKFSSFKRYSKPHILSHLSTFGVYFGGLTG